MTSVTEVLTALTSATGKQKIEAALKDPAAILAWCPTTLVKSTPLSGSETGSVSLALTDMSYGPLTLDDVSADTDAGTLTVSLSAGTLTGDYALIGQPEEQVTMDTGGAMEALSAAAGDGGNPQQPGTISNAQFDQLQQARSQRVKLNQTAHGRTLVGMASQYNDNYNNAFLCSAALRSIWQRNDSVTQMMSHTSNALDAADIAELNEAGGTADGDPPTDQVINPDDTYFGNDIPPHQKSNFTYNYQAFSKKLALYSTLLFSPDPKQQAAAPSVLNFGTDVQSNTGNTQTTIVKMTGPTVYQAVQDGSVTGDAAPNGHDDLVLAMRHIGAGTHTDDHVTLCHRMGLHVADDQIADIQMIYREARGLKTAANTENPASGDLASGDLASGNLASGPLSENAAAAAYTMTLTQQPDGAITAQLSETTLNLAGLGIDTASWDGPWAAASKQALAAASFFVNLVQARITGYVEMRLRAVIAAESGS